MQEICELGWAQVSFCWETGAFDGVEGRGDRERQRATEATQRGRTWCVLSCKTTDRPLYAASCSTMCVLDWAAVVMVGPFQWILSAMGVARVPDTGVY